MEYMTFEHAIQTGIPFPALVGLALLTFVCFIGLYITKLLSIRSSCLLLLASYLMLLLFTTVVFRKSNPEYQCILIPFNSYITIFNNPLSLSPWEVALNFVVFIPVGFLAGGIAKNKGLVLACLIGFSTSLIIECLQLFLKRGVFEVDDLIHNTVGCLIGYGLYRSFVKTFVRL